MGESRSRRHRVGRDRGAVVVEAALVLPLFLLLICGIIDFGLVLSDSIAVRQGVREAARQATAGEVSTTSCTTTGTIANTGTRALVCLAKERTGLDADSTRVRVELKAVTGIDYRPGGAVVVCVMYPMSSVTGLFGPGLNGRVQTAEVQMRLEDDDVSGGLATGGETALPGQNWDFCEPA